ncbi:MAG: hypothetical protein SO016_09425 [Lachnospiraceae bacterium]|nr:hypothetical protein [Robinsoniella sp.]MDY3766891.1 hypothetical protein [Lachnospiraceae bacterium]
MAFEVSGREQERKERSLAEKQFTVRILDLLEKNRMIDFDEKAKVMVLLRKRGSL